ncbi:aspartyl protease family protein [Chromobacterium subtsugae]|uniref:aspartyl protease family protein n=1 Tax=Chromobacterium subtsugae TaxID=251747 RepID=UPI0009BA8570|nr:aspartyl protease family protein [Chromobacterium subtsugae]
MNANKKVALALLAGSFGFASPAQSAPSGADSSPTPFSVPLAKQANGFVAVKARLNGVDGRFLLDSGASMTCVDRKQAARFGLENQGTTRTSHGSAGATEIKRVADKRLEWGGRLAADKLAVYLTDFDAINQGLAEEGVAAVDGVIGMDVLAEQYAVLDYGQQQLRLGKDAKPAAAFDRLPLTSLGGRQLMLEGVINGVKGRFIIDTAAGGTFVTDDAHAARFHLVRQPGANQVHGVGGSVESHFYLLDSLQLGPRFTLRQQKVETMDLAGVNASLKAKGLEEVDGLLGANVLNQGAAVFDIGQQVLQLKPLI